MPVTQRGYAGISIKLKTLNNFQQWARPAVEKGVEAMYKEATTYAPDFAGNTYDRTGRLKASMERLTRAPSGGIVGTVFGTGTRAPHGVDYTGLVKVAGSQARIHAKHGWKTDVQDLDKAQPKIDAEMAKAVKQVLR